MQTRRGFLKLLGIGAAAVVVGPTLLKAAGAVVTTKAVSNTVVTDSLNQYFLMCSPRFNEAICRNMWARNPFLELVDPAIAEEMRVETEARDYLFDRNFYPAK